METNQMYTTRNFKSKKELKEAVATWNDYAASGIIPAGCSEPKPVRYYQPGPFGGNEPKDGRIYIEGPHYPAPHRFYAMCTAENGVIVKVK
jgi:hypothetical protein